MCDSWHLIVSRTTGKPVCECVNVWGLFWLMYVNHCWDSTFPQVSSILAILLPNSLWINKDHIKLLHCDAIWAHHVSLATVKFISVSLRLAMLFWQTPFAEIIISLCVCVCVTALMWLSFTVNDQASEPKTQMTNVMYWLAYKRP